MTGRRRGAPSCRAARPAFPPGAERRPHDKMNQGGVRSGTGNVHQLGKAKRHRRARPAARKHRLSGAGGVRGGCRGDLGRGDRSPASGRESHREPAGGTGRPAAGRRVDESSGREPVMKKDGLPDYAALMVVGVDAYQLGVPEGRLFNCYLESYIPFYGFMDLFLRIDQILDALDHPQATFERRWLSGRDLDNMAAKPPCLPAEILSGAVLGAGRAQEDSLRQDPVLYPGALSPERHLAGQRGVARGQAQGELPKRAGAGRNASGDAGTDGQTGQMGLKAACGRRTASPRQPPRRGMTAEGPRGFRSDAAFSAFPAPCEMD